MFTPDDFKAEAIIVNFYGTKSHMGGHKDDLELTFDAPVVSVSTGLPAIFLLGYKDKTQEPVKILVRPGDIMVMGGQSRLSVHGMPRILYDISVPRPGLLANFDEARMIHFGEDLMVDDFDFVIDYLKSHRININIRKVLPQHMTSIPNNVCS